MLKGQRIGEPEGFLGTAVHAPTSGTVVNIARHPMAHPSGLDTECVVIEPDGAERWIEHAPFDHHAASREESLAWLRDCGIVGLGGATFPSHVKLGKGSGIETLILNGAECEPWITCDDRLMRERAADVLAGAIILRELIGARELVIGIEDNKPEAIAAMQQAAAASAHGVKVVAVPALYPAGGEKQLIRVLTGIEIPYGKLGGDYGVQCFNVGTAHAVYRAFAHGEPLISRIVTLTGNVANAGNWEVLIGTPIEDLLPLARPRADTDRYLMGGPMMGFALPRLDVPMVKGSNCIISASPRAVPAAAARAALHPLHRVRQGLPGRAAALRAVLVQPLEELRQGAGIPPLRLHRVRLLQLRVPGAHPAGRLLPLLQERDLGARAREGRRRPGPRALRVPQLPPGAREGRESRQARRQGRRDARQAGRGRCGDAPAAADAARRRRPQEGPDRCRAGARQGAEGRGPAAEHRQPEPADAGRDRRHRGPSQGARRGNGRPPRRRQAAAAPTDAEPRP